MLIYPRPSSLDKIVSVGVYLIFAPVREVTASLTHSYYLLAFTQSPFLVYDADTISVTALFSICLERHGIFYTLLVCYILTTTYIHLLICLAT